MSVLSTLRRLWTLDTRAKRRAVGSIALGVTGSICTVLILAGAGYVAARASERPGWGAIAGVLAGVEVLAIVRGPLRYAERLISHDIALERLVTWRTWFVEVLIPLAPGVLSEKRSGDLLARLTDDVDSLVDMVVRVVLPAVVSVVSMAAGVGVIAVLLPSAGLWLGVAVASSVLAGIGATFAVSTNEESDARLRGEQRAELLDLIVAMPDVLAFGYEQVLTERIEELDRRRARFARRDAALRAIVAAIGVLGSGAGLIAVTISAVSAATSHRLDPVLLGALALGALGTFETSGYLPLAVLRARGVAAASRRLLDVSEMDAPVDEPPHPVSLPLRCRPLVFDAVSVAYAPTQRSVLDGVDLTLASGAAIGILGASGAGKSTLVHALMRFIGLSNGAIRFGDVDLASADGKEVRRRMALLDQDVAIFSGTIRSNLLLGKSDASDDELFEALSRAHLAEFVDTLPLGLDSPVGEDGVALSGGQRQRLGLARVLLRGSDVIVLDEATASLDRRAGAALVADVVNFAKESGRTLVVITHRTEDLGDLDSSVLLAGGCIHSN